VESALLPIDLPGSLRSGRLDRDDLAGLAGALVQFLDEQVEKASQKLAGSKLEDGFVHGFSWG
jgi:hypothetical protein